MVWDIPKWDNPGQSPPEQKKTDGWAVGDKPPADWLNWFMNKTSENLTEAKTGIETNTTHLAEKASETDALRNTTDKTVTGAINELKGMADELETKTASYSKVKSGTPVDGIYPVVTWKRGDGTTYKTSTLSGGTAPQWTTRTEVVYQEDGITVESTKAYTLSYDADGYVVSEV